MAEDGRHLWSSPGPASLLNQSQLLKQTAEDHVTMTPDYLHTWRLHNLSRQPLPVLHLPDIKKVLPYVQMFQVEAIASWAQ